MYCVKKRVDHKVSVPLMHAPGKHKAETIFSKVEHWGMLSWVSCSYLGLPCAGV